MYEFSMTIDGAPVRTGQTLDVVNPATESVMGAAPVCTAEILDRAMDSAARAYAGWRSDDEARRKAMVAAADTIRDHVAELASILTAEQGKPLAESTRECYGCASWLEYFADADLADEVIQDDERARVVVRRQSVGVVAAIAPWNVPLALAFFKVAPALKAGNPVVLKPSPYTPLSTLRVGELLGEVLPPGVFNVVSGRDELGEWMTRHPIPRKVSFTGSVPVGLKVAAAAAVDLKRVILELGGNDAAIILDDVDVDTAADGIVANAFSNAGQVCCAIKRVYVPERLYADLRDALVERTRAITVGDGSDPATRMGPLTHALQRGRVADLVAGAQSAGGRVLTGGEKLDRPGYFYSPTIVVDAPESVDLVRDEQFGPALPILSYRDESSAIAAANGTDFGLAGSVWSSDLDRAGTVADQLDCGTVWVNTHKDLAVHQPFGGRKKSGIGVENGRWGLDAYTELQVQHRPR